MAIALVGEIVNSCDATTGFNTGGLSGDDDFVEGTGALGRKVSSTTQEMYTTSLGASAPYDFSSGGGEDGFHIIMWFNTKTPIDATTGLRIVVGDGTARGHWYVTPTGFYKGGFITKVIDTAADFDNIAAGSWTTTGNPAQLTGITQVGGVFTTITSIMGSFNNIQLDQMTIGTGVRADAGSIGVPNTFEIVRAADEDSAFWGWWSSSNGAVVGKGKLFIGPSAGSTTSVFTDSAFSVTFANELVAVGFYEISVRGAGTDVSWNLANISAADPTVARWSLTVDSTTNSFADVNGVWQDADQLVLDSSVSLTGTSLINCSKLTQASATLSGISVISANTADSVAFIESDDPSLISDSTFTFSDGHAIEITATGTFSFSGNTFTDYLGTPGTNLVASSGSTDAGIYNSSGGLVTLNIVGGGNTPSVRNAAGSTTAIVTSVGLELNGLSEHSFGVFIGSGGAEDGTELLSGYANSSGVISGTFGGATPQTVVVRARNGGIIAAAIQEDNGSSFTDFTLVARDTQTANDVDLFPSTVSANDAFYFGGVDQFAEVLINVTTAGTTYVAAWEYWDGGAWVTLTVTDPSSSYFNLGWHKITFTPPGDWGTTSVNSQGPYYYIRSRVTTGGGSQPFAETITLNQTVKYLPFNSSGTIQAGTGLTSTAVWIEDNNNG